MIADLKPYPAMKNSGVPWLEAVPEHWKVQPIGRIGQLFKGNGGNKGDEVPAGIPCVRYGDLYTKHEFFIRSAKAYVSEERATAYTPIRYSDVLFAASGETIEDIGKSAVNLLETDARCGGDILLFRPEVDAVPEFLGYASDSAASRNQKACMGRGFTVVHIYGSQLKGLALPLPPLREQAAIARFLDYADRRIRRYIRAKQKLIKLLEEQKQAIIHRAVTRGLDPNVRLKPSGVEWLGNVPEHWEVVKLSRWFRFTSGATPSRSMGGYFGGDIPWVKTGELLNGEIRNAAESITQKGLRETNLSLLPVDTLLIAMYGQGQTRGRTGLLKMPATVNQAALAILPSPSRARPEYLQLWFIAHYGVLRHLSEARSATQPNLNAEIVKSLKIVLPPLVEQQRIMEAVGSATTSIEAGIGCARKEIALLHEYRTRLIADVVTGKLDVREATARLPDETDIAVPLDDFEPEPADDEAATDGSGDALEEAEE